MDNKKSDEESYVRLPFERRVITDHEDFSEEELLRCGIYRLLPDRAKAYAKKRSASARISSYSPDR